MIGAICGDIVGSVYEFNNLKSKEFDFFAPDAAFTDDSVLTLATMDVLLNGKNYAETYKDWFEKYPDSGYGGGFLKWGLSDSLEPYNSWGNGSAMRVSPVGCWYKTMEETRKAAAASARVTHNHPEGIKGAEATAAAIFLARTGSEKADIKKYVEEQFEYDLTETVDSIRSWYRFDESCQGTVPQAIICFLEASNFEDAIRNAISVGGDSDTLACITGGIAEAFFGVPVKIINETLKRLPKEMENIVREFYMNLEK